MSRSPAPGVPMRITTGVARCAAAALLMWRVLEVRPLVTGTALGLLGGAIAAWMLDRRRLRLALRLAVAGAVAWIAAAVAAGSWRGPLEMPRVMTTFLSIGLPAGGLRGLALLAVAVTLPATAVTVWGALGARSAAFVGGPTAALLAASLLAAPRALPLPAVVGVCAVTAVMILVDARRGDEHLEPLVPGTDHRRQARRGPAAAAALAAIAAGVAVTAAPGPHPFDLRRFVHPDVLRFADDNPLAHAARLQVDPPDPAADVDATISVDGPSPGRLRLAVLDTYTPEGWTQAAGFAATGRWLAPGPIVDPRRGASTTVTVIDGPGGAGLRGVPTGGTPVSVDGADHLRYAADAGILLAPGRIPAAIRYRTRTAGASAPGSTGDAVVGRAPEALFGCPGSAVIEAAADAFAAVSSDPVQRLRAIESWLKLKRIYDPRAPGGQTLGSVEQFVGQDMSRGNMEAFVTAAAVLARCAGVPVRVVVGYPAPAADSVTPYRARQVTAWIEAPLARQGWVAVDPIPTAAEQQRQVELAQQPPPPPADSPPATAVRPPIDVESAPPAGAPAAWWWILGVVGGLGVTGLVWLALIPRIVRARRRRTAAPPAAVLAGWREVTDRLVDRKVPLLAHFTPSETAAATTGHVGASVAVLLAQLGVLTDRARYDAESVTPDHAGTGWALVDAIEARLARSAAAAVSPLRHPIRWLRRLADAYGEPAGRTRWNATLTADELVEIPELTEQIAGVHVDHEIGAGSTSVVYRGHLLDDGRAVAVKVFRFTVDQRPFDRQRFEWEARIAGLVSGHVNLPEVYASGVTAIGQPFLVTKLYGRGTLTARVQRGGPLSPGEIVALGQSLCLALDTLHRNSILHGDVKPDNVFIDDDGTPILGDLGSAWVRAEGGPAASMTPPYAAPEVWLGQHPSKMSDLYSLGLTLMFAATGRSPIAGAPPTADDIDSAFGTELYDSLLEIDPRRRPRTARDAARHLGADVDDPSLAWRTAVVLPTPTLVR